MPLGAAKDGHFSFFQRSCQLALIRTQIMAVKIAKLCHWLKYLQKDEIYDGAPERKWSRPKISVMAGNMKHILGYDA